MRRFYFAQISKYNLEEWYPALEKLAEERKIQKGIRSFKFNKSISNLHLLMLSKYRVHSEDSFLSAE